MADIGNLGKYEVRREIGRGAMGVVYEGYDPSIKRIVALKTIRPDPLTGEAPAAVIARFRREAQAAGRLNHPHIVSIHDFGEEADACYIAMEFVRGRELKECFEANERFDLATTVRIMGQILDALDYSHRQGVIHRDVKPANIFLLDDGSVKVADFGIAHIESSNLTQVGTVLGTPSYMSPEQIMGLPVDGRTDVFSAGVILYQFLTGERPFAGSATTTMQKVLKQDPLPPSTLNVQVPPGLDAVVGKALAKRPDERYQTAREFADALRSAIAPRAADTDATLMAPRTASGDATPMAPRSASGDATYVNSPATEIPREVWSASAVRDPTASAVTSASPAPVASRSRPSGAAIAIAALAGVLVIGGTAWLLLGRAPAGPPQSATASPPPQAPSPIQAQAQSPTPPAPAQAQAPTPVPVAPAASATAASQSPAAPPGAPALAESAVPPAAPGAVLISAVGWVDPTDSRYQADKTRVQADLRADSRGQAVEKALGMLLEASSVAGNYELLHERVLAKSGDFITAVIRESPPQLGRDGLMSMTTEAVVDVKAVQRSLNAMSRDQRVKLIRASGDPGVSVRITVRDADQADAPAMPSPVAENILKERIKSFGFRTWAEGDAAQARKGADFAVVGEARVRKLSTRLAASGLVVSKFALTSWTIKGIDRQTGEEIHHSTALPKAMGSWASEEEAMRAIGAGVAEQFSRDLFLQHTTATRQKITLEVEGMPGGNTREAFARELIGLPQVIAATPLTASGYELQLIGNGIPADLVALRVLKPLNTKLGRDCFSPGGSTGSRVVVRFDPACAEQSVLERLELNPPAALYGAPAARQRTVVKNPDTLRKLNVGA